MALYFRKATLISSKQHDLLATKTTADIINCVKTPITVEKRVPNLITPDTKCAAAPPTRVAMQGFSTQFTKSNPESVVLIKRLVLSDDVVMLLTIIIIKKPVIPDFATNTRIKLNLKSESITL